VIGCRNREGELPALGGRGVLVRRTGAREGERGKRQGAGCEYRKYEQTFHVLFPFRMEYEVRAF
jgi:hypothetical protein